MRLLAVLLAVGACVDVGDQQSAREKFITFIKNRGQAGYRLSLMHKVHNQTIAIRYGFVPECAGKYSHAQVKRDVEQALRLWLQPLRDWPALAAAPKTFVDNFSFVREETSPHPDPNKNRYVFTLSLGSDLDIIFYCRSGLRSFVSIASNQMRIHLYDEGVRYSQATLVHEVGHVFGLGDTYVDAAVVDGKIARYNKSDCGSPGTVGCQPLSVMSDIRWILAGNSRPQLLADDIAGIRWIYRYIHGDGDKQCPRGYVAESSTDGCVPEDLLAFALRQGDYDSAIALMLEQNIPLDLQDQGGNTILHYAARRVANHGGHIYAKAVEAGASPDLKNNSGETPRGILFSALKEAMSRGNIGIAQELIARAID